MNAERKQSLEKQVALLRELQDVLNREKTSLTSWDLPHLHESARRKEEIAGGLRRIAAAGQGSGHGSEQGGAPRDPEAARLVRARDGLARDLKEQVLARMRVFQEHAERVDQAIRFLQHVHAPGHRYDAQGRLR